MTDSASTTSISGRALTTWIVIGVGLGFAAFLASLAVLDGKDPDPGDVVKALPAVAALVALSRAVDVILQLVGSKASKRHEKLQAQAYDEVRELYRHCWNGALLATRWR